MYPLRASRRSWIASSSVSPSPYAGMSGPRAVNPPSSVSSINSIVIRFMTAPPDEPGNGPLLLVDDRPDDLATESRHSVGELLVLAAVPVQPADGAATAGELGTGAGG